MQIYEKRNDPSYHSTPRCGYCRQEGHNRSQCPVAPQDWEYWKNYQVPVNTIGWYRSRDNPEHWGKWFLDCRRTMDKIEQRKKRENKVVVRSPSKCGYCRSEDHTRRQCPEMKEFLQKCYKANENWRRAAYKELVEKHGISVGAAIEVKAREGWGTTAQIKTEVALITKVNFESLNVMAAKTGYYTGYSNPYDCSLEVHALVDNKEVMLKLHTTDTPKYSDTWLKDVISIDSNVIVNANGSGYYQSWHLSKVLSRAEQPLDESWVKDYKAAFDLLLKKRTKEQLDNDGITSLIEEWLKKV